MTNFKNLRDGRRDGRAPGPGPNDNNNNGEQAPKCVRTSLASRLTRSLRRRMPSRADTSASRGGSQDENERNLVSVMSSITGLPTTSEPVARPRRRSVAADRRSSTGSNYRHPYSYRRSEYLNDLQAVFISPSSSAALSPKDTVHPPAEVLADLLQVELQPYQDRRDCMNRRLGSEEEEGYIHIDSQDISFFDYDFFKNEREDSVSPFEPVKESRSPGRETGFRMIYPLSDEGHGSDSDLSSWLSDASSATSDTDSQVSVSPRGSQLSIIRAASIASLKN